ncbi:sulfotransferase [Candidatus Kaiserbacteria bacterium]|nr:sulfotransferase [Candidatus Kaiserbacteria bacterium]
MKAVFILSCGHSGSTLLDILLDSHSSVVGVGEMHGAKPNRPCTCGRRAGDCEVWRDALGAEPWQRREIYRPKLSYLLGRGPYFYSIGKKPVDDAEFTGATMRAYAQLLKRFNASIIVDSSKEVERAELIARDPNVEVIIIHLVRDGRGTTWSYIRKYKKLIPYLFMWFLSNVKIEIFKRRFKRRILFLRYEDLADNPEATLRKLCEKIGIPFEPAMLEFDKKEHHQIEGNRMRFVPGHAIHRDDKWRHDMPLWLRALFTLCFGWLNAFYAHKESLV